MSGNAHIPVMLGEVVEALRPSAGGVLVDGTFGFGGYTRALLETADCSVVAIDRDEQVLTRARAMEALYGERLILVHGRFGGVAEHLRALGIASIDGLTLDLGVSSLQLDDGERGFSFLRDGPLDMRMGGAAESGTPSAADVVAEADEKTLAAIFSAYGEERRAKTVARAIIAAREEALITRTLQLADIIEGVLGKGKPGDIHPATRAFQGLRIHVNDELRELTRALFAAEALLKPGGRLAVVSFHSLEDRIVKTFLNARAGKGGGGSRHRPEHPDAARATSFALTHRGVIKPREEEVAANPRARSAKLRVAERTKAPAFAQDWDALSVPGEGFL